MSDFDGPTLPAGSDPLLASGDVLLALGLAPVPELETLAPLFPEYELLEQVGAGGMGVVYKARHHRLDRCVALKLLNPRVAEEPAFHDRFEREARALARLDHPSIAGALSKSARARRACGQSSVMTATRS